MKKAIIALLILCIIPLLYIYIVREVQKKQQISCNLDKNITKKRLSLNIGKIFLTFDVYAISSRDNFIYCRNSTITESEMVQIAKYLKVPEFSNIVGICLSLNSSVADSATIEPKSITYLSISNPRCLGLYNLEAFYKRQYDGSYHYIDSLSEVVNYVLSSSQNYNKTLVCDTTNFKTQITLVLNEKENHRNYIMY
jgi:hypothetical protein